MTRDDKRPRQPRLTDGEREKASRAKRRKQRQDDHRLKTAEERELRASMGSSGGKQSKAAQRRKNEE